MAILCHTTDRAPPAPIGARGAARSGESTIARDRAGGGRLVLYEWNSGEENGDVNAGRRGGASGRMGASNVETTKGLVET